MEPVFSTKELTTILENIESGNTIKEMVQNYKKFKLTKSDSLIDSLNIYIRLKNPELWKEIEKPIFVKNQSNQSIWDQPKKLINIFFSVLGVMVGLGFTIKGIHVLSSMMTIWGPIIMLVNIWLIYQIVKHDDVGNF